jgi:hypothetical protein
MASLISTLSIAYTPTPNEFYPRHIQRNSGALLGLTGFNVVAETLKLPYGGLQLQEKAAQAEIRLQPPVTEEICASADLYRLDVRWQRRIIYRFTGH